MCFEERCRHGIWCLCEEQCAPPPTDERVPADLIQQPWTSAKDAECDAETLGRFASDMADGGEDHWPWLVLSAAHIGGDTVPFLIEVGASAEVIHYNAAAAGRAAAFAVPGLRGDA